MIKVKRLEIGETMTASLFEINGIELKTTEWDGWHDDANNIIWLKSYADFKILFHEILHYFTDKFIPFVKLRNLIHYAIIDKYPRWMELGLFGVKQIW